MEQVVSYNPMSTRQGGRNELVLRVCKWASVIVLQGSRDKATTHHALQYYVQDGFMHFVAGFGPKSCKHAGVRVCLNMKYHEYKHIHSVAFPEDKVLQGRALAVRSRRPGSDVTFIGAYIPPQTAKGSSKVAVLLVNWIVQLIWSLPRRSVPVLCLDANARIGEDDAGNTFPELIGRFGGTKENHNGSLFRQLLVDTHLAASNTFRHNPPTFYSGSDLAWTSRIDFICLPPSLLGDTARPARVDHDLGRKLQLVNSCRNVDHHPVVQSICRRLHQYSPDNVRFFWDYDKLHWMLRNSFAVSELHKKINTSLETHEHEWDEAVRTGAITKMYRLIVGGIFKAARDEFGARKDNKHAEFRKEQLELLLVRVKLRMSVSVTGLKLRDIFAQWHCWYSLEKTTRKLKSVRKHEFKTRRLAMVSDLTRAWAQRKLARAWRLMREITRTKRGPNQRWAGVPKTANPTMAQWEEKLKLRGGAGGWMAHRITSKDFSDFESVEQHDEHSGPIEMNCITQADADMRSIKFIMRKTANRTCVPEGDVPAEIWKAILWPKFFIRDQHVGLGALPENTGVCVAESKLLLLLRHMRASRRTPLDFNFSKGFTLPKKAGSHIVGDFKDLTADNRVIHCFGCIPKVFFKALTSRCDYQPRYYAHGALAHRCREDAIAVQVMIGRRLFVARVPFCSRYYDVRNAFPSPDHDSCDEFVINCFPPDDVCFMRQHIQEHVCELDCLDGKLMLQVGSGLPQGCSSGPFCFNGVYADVLDNFLVGIKVLDKNLVVQSIVSDEELHLGCTNFVDDVGNTMTGETNAELIENSEGADECFAFALKQASMEQNKDKLVAVYNFFGDGAHQKQKEVLTNKSSRAAVQARYLGPIIRWDFGNKVEIDKRLKSAGAVWFCLGAFWYSESQLKFKKVVFRGGVLSVLLTGLKALVLSTKDIERLQTFVVACGRKLMRGEGCVKSTTGGIVSYKQKPNSEVLTFLGVAPIETELRVARLRWYQQVFKYQLDHQQFLTALFCKLPFESSFPTGKSHPWYEQFVRDMQEVENFDDQAWIWEAFSGNFRDMLKCEDAVVEFTNLDFNMLRAKHLSVSIPPVGTSVRGSPLLVSQDANEHVDARFVCDLLNKNTGAVCGLGFDNFKALNAHQSGASEHDNQFSLVSVLQFPVCPWCSTHFATQAACCNHVRGAQLRGYCKADRNIHMSSVSLDIIVDCCLCGLKGLDFVAYQQHIREHILPPAHLYFDESWSEGSIRGSRARLQARPQGPRSTRHGQKDERAAKTFSKVMLECQPASASVEECVLGGDEGAFSAKQVFGCIERRYSEFLGSSKRDCRPRGAVQEARSDSSSRLECISRSGDGHLSEDHRPPDCGDAQGSFAISGGSKQEDSGAESSKDDQGMQVLPFPEDVQEGDSSSRVVDAARFGNLRREQFHHRSDQECAWRGSCSTGRSCSQGPDGETVAEVPRDRRHRFDKARLRSGGGGVKSDEVLTRHDGSPFSHVSCTGLVAQHGITRNLSSCSSSSRNTNKRNAHAWPDSWQCSSKIKSLSEAMCLGNSLAELKSRCQDMGLTPAGSKHELSLRILWSLGVRDINSVGNCD